MPVWSNSSSISYLPTSFTSLGVLPGSGLGLVGSNTVKAQALVAELHADNVGEDLVTALVACDWASEETALLPGEGVDAVALALVEDPALELGALGVCCGVCLGVAELC
jgi:hypothetical protein